MVNSRQKGKRGERDARDALNELGFKTRRGQQFSGGPESPDVVGVPGVHFEVKMVEALNLDAALRQSAHDCGHNIPVVLHRKKRTPWTLTTPLMCMEDLCVAWLQGLGWTCLPPKVEPLT